MDSKRSSFNKILKSPNYTDFKNRLAQSGCRRCRLCESRTNIVVDRGSPNAKIMVIGEGPGKNEDREGAAFVGRAGKLLDRLFSSIKLDTGQDTLISNIVKCRPPGNRAPNREEAESCMPFLRKQIDLVRPRLLLLRQSAPRGRADHEVRGLAAPRGQAPELLA